MSKRILGIGVLVFVMFGWTSLVQAQLQWTNLNGPYWASGKDVAAGLNEESKSFNRYFIASNSGESLYYWGQTDSKWSFAQGLNGANKVVSYKLWDDQDDHGQIAFCSVLDEDIYKSLNGGQSWSPMNFSENNKQFTAVEVPNSTLNNTPGDVVMVSCAEMDDEPSTFYTTDGGSSWDPIGGTSSVGWQVNDIESFPEPDFPPDMAIGTTNGIYRKLPSENGWDDDWGDPVAFAESNVVVLESADYNPDMAQFAAVQRPNAAGLCNIYFAPSYRPWDEHVEIRPGNNSFDKVVADMAAIDWGNNKYSCYVATPQGLFRLVTAGSNYAGDPVDIKELPNTSGFYPMKSDSNVVAVDYFLEDDGTYKAATILAATPFNLYQITEVRDASGDLVGDIEIADADNDIYLANVSVPLLPINTTMGRQIFALTSNGLVNEADQSGVWTLAAKDFTDNSHSWSGTDIAANFSEENDYLLASSVNDGYGTIMLSIDGGLTWAQHIPAGNPVVKALDLDPNSTYAYAAGASANIWHASDAGVTWLASSTTFDNPDFKDILADPSEGRDGYVYVGGSGDYKFWQSSDHGVHWSPLENGLDTPTEINQLAKSVNDDRLYAVTDNGVYKIYIAGVTPTWIAHNNGISTNLGSIVIEKYNLYDLLAATAPDAVTPHIWASGDSGRSWIDYPLGHIPSNCHINKLAASQDNNEGFVAGTDSGAFYLPRIFRYGTLAEDEEWGPGTVIINGDVTVPAGVTLTIDPGTTLLFEYNFDRGSSGASSSKCELIIQGKLKAWGTSGDSIKFCSSKPTSPAPGDWYGIRADSNSIDSLAYCEVKHSQYGVKAYKSSTLIVQNSTIQDNSTSGIYAQNPPNGTKFRENAITSCGTYGIYCYSGSPVVAQNSIDNCLYGFYLSGSGAPSIDTCKITYSAGGTSSYYGVSINKLSVGLSDVIVRDDSINGFHLGGIYFNIVSNTGLITNTKIVSCGTYGIYYSGSNAPISGGVDTHNLCRSNSYGIYLYNSSSPNVRRTRMWENTSYGARCESGSLPDFGKNNINDPGDNSFMNSAPSAGYRDLYNVNAGYIGAYYCYWGENPPTAGQIYHANYNPYLSTDPARRAVDWNANVLEDFSLAQIYPNPFNPTASVSFNLSSPQHVTVKVYNIMGQEVTTLLDGFRQAGQVDLIWDGKNSHGVPVSTGVYFCQFRTDSSQKTLKMTMLK